MPDSKSVFYISYNLHALTDANMVDGLGATANSTSPHQHENIVRDCFQKLLEFMFN